MKKELQLLETIKLKDGLLFNLAYHQKRMIEASQELWGQKTRFVLKDFLKIQEFQQPGLFKVRIIYGINEIRQETASYVPKLIKSLKLVHADEIDYGFKYANRSELNNLAKYSAGCDEILIVKGGQITDTTFSNVAFYDGKEWWTPQFPLLAGTQRAKMITEGRLKETVIRPDDLNYYKEVRLINALMELKDGYSIKIKNIL